MQHPMFIMLIMSRVKHLRKEKMFSNQKVSPGKSEVRIAFSLDSTSDVKDERKKDEEDLNQTFPDLEQRLQPVPPCVTLKESVLVYKEHCKMAREYHKVECEIAALEERKRRLQAELQEDKTVARETARQEEEFRCLSEENRALLTVHEERARLLKSLCATGESGQDSS
ncbi:MAP3K7 C-terminal-like protein isoform X2 [Nelusetta ayraudi]|uniref:MAP3K7 C-terminal-like protein isoform X2 n=2 Tax=Nelusetta ayraudi TaxID=303726 RepID=UPI003F72A828